MTAAGGTWSAEKWTGVPKANCCWLWGLAKLCNNIAMDHAIMDCHLRCGSLISSVPVYQFIFYCLLFCHYWSWGGGWKKWDPYSSEVVCLALASTSSSCLTIIKGKVQTRCTFCFYKGHSAYSFSTYLTEGHVIEIPQDLGYCMVSNIYLRKKKKHPYDFSQGLSFIREWL